MLLRVISMIALLLIVLFLIMSVEVLILLGGYHWYLPMNNFTHVPKQKTSSVAKIWLSNEASFMQLQNA